VFATNVGGIPEVIEDGITGLLRPAGDVKALSGAVESLLNDPARRTALGQSAQSRAKAKFSSGIIVPRYLALYREVCGRTR